MATIAAQKSITVEQFLLQYGENNRYELIDGEVFDLEPTGPHEQVAALIDRKLNVQIEILNLPYFILQRGTLKPLGNFTAFRPDIMVVNDSALSEEPLWKKESILTMGQSVKLVAEVVSSNWQNDYARKFEDYALLGIPEYWIVDHEGLGGEVFIGRPKQPTLTLCLLGEDGRYQTTILRGDDAIVSPVFSHLSLTANQVLRTDCDE
ncbi:MAG: Uma2 family endonuclease [Cyanobacteria bacterium J06581_3]